MICVITVSLNLKYNYYYCAA